jgi:hypothetical protein
LKAAVIKQLWPFQSLLYVSVFGSWCFTHQYKNTTQFYFYAALFPSQNTNQKKRGNLTIRNICLHCGGYGRTLCINGDYYGKKAPNMDCYYIAVDANYKMHIGIQQSGSSATTWDKT